MKSVRIQSFPGSHISGFGLNTERSGVFKNLKSVIKLGATNDYFENYSELNLTIAK